MKYIITQLVNQKQELEEKLAKTTPHTKLPAPSSTLKKPSPANLKSNVKYIPISNPKKALTLKCIH
jgi:hypothetical protein